MPRPGARQDALRAANPKVSVLMTTYNHERYVRQAIEGVLMQETDFLWEFVIGEDASTDGTRKIVEEFAERFPERIRVVLPERNLGPNAMYMATLHAVKGDYIAMLDGDDYWTSATKLQRQVDYMDQHPECSITFHDVITDLDGVIQDRPFPDLPERSYELADLLFWNFLPSASVVTRRFTIDDLEPWFLDCLPLDWLSWIAVARKGSVGYIKEALAVYRIHSHGLWWGGVWEDHLATDLEIFERLKPVLGEDLAEPLLAGQLLRRVALAVEEAGVPFAYPVLVVSEVPARWWNFNGRKVMTTAGSASLCLDEIERLRRRARSSSERKAEVKSRAQATVPGGTSHLITTVHSPAAVQGWSRVEESLKDCPRIFANDYCSIYELPAAQEIVPRLVLGVARAEPMSDELLGGSIDLPVAKTELHDGGVEVAGWALGRSQDVAAIEFWVANEKLKSVPADVDRPDVAQALGVSTPAGFHTWVDLLDIEGMLRLEVFVQLTDGRRHPLGRIQISSPNH